MKDYSVRLATILFLIVLGCSVALWAVVGVGGRLVEIFAVFAVAAVGVTWWAIREFARVGVTIRCVEAALAHGEVAASSGARVERALMAIDEAGRTTPTMLAYSVDVIDIRERVAPSAASVVEHAPAVFTALGILFTFVGLITGLSSVDPGGSSERLQAGIGQLVNGLGVAFFSSVVGIALSLATLASTRLQTAFVRQACARLRDTAESTWPELSPHTMKHATLQATQKLVTLAEDQKVAMNQLASDIAGQVTQRLGDVIQSSVGEPLESLQLSMSEFTSSGADAHAEALSGVMDTFSATFTQQLARRFEELQGVLEDVAKWHSATHEQYQRTWKQLAAHVDAHGAQMATERELLDERTALEQQLLKGRVQLGERMAAVVEALGQTTTDVARFEVLLSDAISGQGQATNQLALATGSLTEEGRKVAEGTELLRRSIDEAARPLVDQYERLIGQVQDQLRNALTDSFNTFDSEMAKVVSHLSGTFAQLQDTLDRIDSSTRRVPSTTHAQ